MASKISNRFEVREDDFASNIQIGIAQFPRSALKPLEAQGRGFTHGHEKIISVPQTRAARLKQLFTNAAATEHGEDELSRWCQQAREAVIYNILTYDKKREAQGELLSHMVQTSLRNTGAKRQCYKAC